MNATDCGCVAQDPGASIANSPICNGTLVFMTLLQGLINQNCNITEPCKRVVGVSELESEHYDFVVVGGGSAGAIVAGRLSESGKFSVLLLEAGGPDPVASRVPSFYRNFWHNNEVDWMYTTEPSDQFCLSSEGNRCVWPRGKTLGGTSVLNGMMYHRGHEADYDDWVAFGAEGWSLEDTKPYFDKFEDNKQIGTVVSDEYHTSGGPMPIQQFRYITESQYDLLDAVNATGIPIIEDMNDPNTPEGAVIAQAFNDGGQRVTPARAYLVPETERPNLNVLLNSHVTRVLFNGTEAIGVEYIFNGTTKNVYANKEVILSAGALNSPHILMLSGIGPQETLENFGIEVLADLPVGQNLINHVGVEIGFLLTNLNNTQVLSSVAADEYLANQTGVMTSTGITGLTVLTYSSLGNRTRGQPDLQFFFNGFYAECSSSGEVDEPLGACCLNGRNFSMDAVSLLPRSVGYMTLNSTDPLDPPLFYPNYFNNSDDITMLKDAIQIIKNIAETDIFQSKYGIELDEKYLSTCSNSSDPWSDEWAECMIRTYTDPQNHQVGTAAISTVIDTELRVKNVTGLRVIDASCAPTLLTGNIQATIMMVAERGSEMILKDYGGVPLSCEV